MSFPSASSENSASVSLTPKVSQSEKLQHLLQHLRSKSSRKLPYKKVTEMELNKVYSISGFSVGHHVQYGRYIIVLLELFQIILPSKYQALLTDEQVELLNSSASLLQIKITGLVPRRNGRTSADIIIQSKEEIQSETAYNQKYERAGVSGETAEENDQDKLAASSQAAAGID